MAEEGKAIKSQRSTSEIRQYRVVGHRKGKLRSSALGYYLVNSNSCLNKLNIEVWLSLVVYRVAAAGGRRRQGDKGAAVDK